VSGQSPSGQHKALRVPKLGYRGYGVGPLGWASGVLRALPLRAFFCSFSVSDDFFLISCLARLYSAGSKREAIMGALVCVRV
jgi:hypothetical protein